MEGALKIKEMCYLHAEGTHCIFFLSLQYNCSGISSYISSFNDSGYSGGALKHGPFALIESDENGKQGATPIIMLIFDDDHAHHMRTAAEEVKARGADVIIITDKKSLAEGLDPDPLVIPSNGPLTALGAVLPIQVSLL
jgi:glucosamine--fructose-6-phosphate aminotransferase (isomerizing)